MKGEYGAISLYALEIFSKYQDLNCPYKYFTVYSKLLGKDNSLVFEEADAQCQMENFLLLS